MFSPILNTRKTVQALDLWAVETGLSNDDTVNLRKLELMADIVSGTNECSICGKTFKHRKHLNEHK